MEMKFPPAQFITEYQHRNKNTKWSLPERILRADSPYISL
jgi:hypothetical protein